MDTLTPSTMALGTPRRPITVIFISLISCAVLAIASLITTSPTSAATVIAPTTTCSNGMDNTPGLGLICEVTIANTFAAGGGSAIVTVRECHGAAGAPEALCGTQITVLTEPVTAVTQCNNSAWGGGSTLRCTVEITNSFTDASPGVPITVTQCNTSSQGGGSTVDCSVQITNNLPGSGPMASQSVSQCNLTGAGGGSFVNCTVRITNNFTDIDPGTTAFGVTQCDDSASGGGSFVRCSAQVSNTFPDVSPTGSAGTVNQCNASGDGATGGCVPPPATPPGATIVQCNGSANGGTLVGLTCTAPGTLATSQTLTVDQCNRSANGGGSLVDCSAGVTAAVIAPAATPTPTPTPESTPTPVVTPTPTPEPTPTPPAAFALIAPIATPTPAPQAPVMAPVATPTAAPVAPAMAPVATPTPVTGLPLMPVPSFSPDLPDTRTVDMLGAPQGGANLVILGGLLLVLGTSLLTAARRAQFSSPRPDHAGLAQSMDSRRP